MKDPVNWVLGLLMKCCNLGIPNDIWQSCCSCGWLFSSTDCLISHYFSFQKWISCCWSSLPLNMFLVFSSDDWVFCYFFHESLFILSSAYHILYPPCFAILVWSSCPLTIIPPYSTLVFSSLLSMDSSINVENLRANTLCFKSTFSWTCNRLGKRKHFPPKKIFSSIFWLILFLDWNLQGRRHFPFFCF